MMSETYQCDHCGETFEIYDAAKYHVIVNGFPVNPEDMITRKTELETDER